MFAGTGRIHLGDVPPIATVASRLAPPAPATQNGWTPLHWAAWNGYKDVAALLRERGADKEAKDVSGLRVGDGQLPLQGRMGRGDCGVTQVWGGVGPAPHPAHCILPPTLMQQGAQRRLPPRPITYYDYMAGSPRLQEGDVIFP